MTTTSKTSKTSKFMSTAAGKAWLAKKIATEAIEKKIADAKAAARRKHIAAYYAAKAA